MALGSEEVDMGITGPDEHLRRIDAVNIAQAGQDCHFESSLNWLFCMEK